MTLFTELPDGKQYNFEAFQGRFKGHADGIIQGIIQAPKTQHVWEHKDKDHKKFADFQKKKKTTVKKERYRIGMKSILRKHKCLCTICKLTAII